MLVGCMCMAHCSCASKQRPCITMVLQHNAAQHFQLRWMLVLSYSADSTMLCCCCQQPEVTKGHK